MLLSISVSAKDASYAVGAVSTVPRIESYWDSIITEQNASNITVMMIPLLWLFFDFVSNAPHHL